MMKNQKLIAWSKSTRENFQVHRARIDKDANTLTTGEGCRNQSTANFICFEDEKGNFYMRKLHPIECERLQTYNDDHTKYGTTVDGKIYQMSNNQRYVQIGNGVTSVVSAHILENFIPEGNLKIFSLFTGVAGTELKFPNRFEVVAHCEWDKYASDVLRYHHPNIINFGDVSKVLDRKDEVPEFDLLSFTFPCQPYSEAGLRGGLEDKRGQIIYDVFNIIDHFKPKYLFAENVKGLLTHNKGDTFFEICKTISNMGYDFDFDLYNSKNFGVPQIRDRMFLYGIRRGCQP